MVNETAFCISSPFLPDQTTSIALEGNRVGEEAGAERRGEQNGKITRGRQDAGLK